MSEHEEFPTYIHLNEYSNAVSWADDPDSMAIDSTEYVRKDIVQEMLEQQREECAVDAVEAFQEADTMAEIPNAIMRACLNATGESDE